MEYSAASSESEARKEIRVLQWYESPRGFRVALVAQTIVFAAALVLYIAIAPESGPLEREERDEAALVIGIFVVLYPLLIASLAPFFIHLHRDRARPGLEKLLWAYGFASLGPLTSAPYWLLRVRGDEELSTPRRAPVDGEKPKHSNLPKSRFGRALLFWNLGLFALVLLALVAVVIYNLIA